MDILSSNKTMTCPLSSNARVVGAYNVGENAAYYGGAGVRGKITLTSA